MIFFTSGLEFCSDDNNLQQYDIIFLDIGMKEMNGMETAYAIREKNQNVDIVFITIMMDYALEGYRVDAVRYILKDDLESLLPECMDTILQKKTGKGNGISVCRRKEESSVKRDSFY